MKKRLDNMTETTITSIIFDCDGVLVDTEPVMISVLLDMAGELGATMELDEAVRLFSGRQMLETIKMLEENAGSAFPADFEQEFRKRAYARFREGIEPIPGIHAFLDDLKLPYCVASSGPREKILLNLELTGLRRYFPDDRVFSSYEINSWKPDPGIFLHAAEKMGFRREDTAVIEDSIAGVEAAVKGGFRVFAITHGENRRALEERGAVSFSHIRELTGLLRLNRTVLTAGLVVIRDNKLLLAYSNNKKAWYLPGGKVDAGETSLQSLQREIWEELTLRIKAEELKYYCHITAPAYGENAVIMEQDCYLYELSEEIAPRNEIGAVRFFDSESYAKEPAQVVGVLEIFEKLKADRLLL